MFQHSDIGLYILHLSAVKSHKRSVFKKADLDDVRSRLKIVHPTLMGKPPVVRVLTELPQVMQDFISQQGGMWKVEWFYKGGYDTRFSPGYLMRFRPKTEGTRDLYTKVLETLQFQDHAAGHRLWLESLYRPGKVVFYEGVGYQLDTHKTVVQTAKIVSVILDYEHVISATIIF